MMRVLNWISDLNISKNEDHKEEDHKEKDHKEEDHKEEDHKEKDSDEEDSDDEKDDKEEVYCEEDYNEEDLCLCCDNWTNVNKETFCIECAPLIHTCLLCEKTKQKIYIFEPKENDTVFCKDCAECLYCKKEKTGDSWNLKCFNPLCIFKCPGCEEIKPTHLKNMYGGLYEDVCMDCSECKRCGCQMWDYICSCRV
jgi:hypothetical protein